MRRLLRVKEKVLLGKILATGGLRLKTELGFFILPLRRQAGCSLDSFCCPEDKRRDLGMGVFRVRQVLEKGDGRKWTELPTCSEEWACGQTLQAALLRQATPLPEARDKNWPDGQLPRKLAWESCVAESFLGLLPLSLSPASLCRRDASWDPSSGYYKT